MLLTDGGVYDNMATEWPVRLAERVREGAVPTPPPHVCDELIVVNSSAAQGVRTRASVDIPLLGELTELLAVKDVLYDQTTAVRRRLAQPPLPGRPRRPVPGESQASPARWCRSTARRSTLPRQFASGTTTSRASTRGARPPLGRVPETEWEQDADPRAVGQDRAVEDPQLTGSAAAAPRLRVDDGERARAARLRPHPHPATQ